MESTIILCAFLAANIALCGLAWGQSQGCPCAECSVQRNNEHTCPAGDVKFFETDDLTTQTPSPQMFAQQNATYVSTHLTFPCSGYIQRVEIQAKGDESLQNVTLDLHLWRIQNSSTLLFQQIKRFTINFNVTFTNERFIVLSANISERNQSQFYFDEGDILGFTIPANSPVNATSSAPEEPGCPDGRNMTYLLSGNCTPADSSSVCDMPRIGITFGSSSAPLPTSSSTPSTSPSFPVSFSLPSPTPSPAGMSPMTEPTSPTSSQPSNAVLIILGAMLGSIVCALLIIAIIILVICILQRRTKWTHSSTELNTSAPHRTTLEHFGLNTNDAYGTNTAEIATTGMTTGDAIPATPNVAYEQMSDGANARGSDEEQRQIEPQLKDLILVQTVKWYELGLQLEVESKDLDVIQANNQNNIEACKREMFSKWLGITPDASYQQVVEALQIVGEISEADRLCKKYGKIDDG